MALIVTFLLAIFAVLFGTRHADATEHQEGLVLAVAVETVVKLAAFLAVGIAITYFFFAGPLDLARAVSSLPEVQKAYTYPTSLATGS